jgi:hypothetical protein
MTDVIEFTEAERIEISRRLSEVFSILKQAERLFIESIQLQELFAEANAFTKSYWLWGFGILGLVLHYIIKGDLSAGFEFNFGGFILLIVFFLYFRACIGLIICEIDIKKNNEKLYDLERLWSAATFTNTFWELKRFFNVNGFDDHTDDYLHWRQEQRFNIIEAVCEYEKAQKIIDYEKKYNDLKDKEAFDS